MLKIYRKVGNKRTIEKWKWSKMLVICMVLAVERWKWTKKYSTKAATVSAASVATVPKAAPYKTSLPNVAFNGLS